MLFAYKKGEKIQKKIEIVDSIIKQKEEELKEACEKDFVETAAFLRQKLIKLYRQREKLNRIRNKRAL